MQEIILTLITVVFALLVSAALSYALTTDNGVHKFVFFALSGLIILFFTIFVTLMGTIRSEVEKKGD